MSIPTPTRPLAELPNVVMTVTEVAKYLKLSPPAVRRLVAKREIPSFKVGGSRRFHLCEVEAYVASLPREQAADDSEHAA